MREAPATVRPRRVYLDWVRGVAVLLMIEAHLLDSWTRAPDRESPAYMHAMIVGGMGTAFFLMLAGVSVGLSAGSKLRRIGDARSASMAVARRGLQIFGLAFLFRLQAFVLGWSGDPRDLLRVDVLNVMGPSIVLAALVWRAANTVAGRAAVFASAAILTAALTPIVRELRFDWLPDFLAAYLVPVHGLSAFVFFPWLALVLAGAFVGVLIDDAGTEARERRLNAALAGGGIALAAGAYAASYLPSPYARAEFWTSSPAFLFIRVGLVACAIAAAYAWIGSGAPARRWSPLVTLGRSSLFIYWIHVEMVYGLVSLPLHRALTLPRAWAAYALFVVFMLGCAVAKERIVSRLSVPRRQPATAA